MVEPKSGMDYFTAATPDVEVRHFSRRRSEPPTCTRSVLREYFSHSRSGQIQRHPEYIYGRFGLRSGLLFQLDWAAEEEKWEHHIAWGFLCTGVANGGVKRGLRFFLSERSALLESPVLVAVCMVFHRGPQLQRQSAHLAAPAECIQAAGGVQLHPFEIAGFGLGHGAHESSGHQHFYKLPP